MQGLGMEFFTEQRTGQLLSIVNSDVNELDDFLTDILRSVIQIVTRHLAMAAVLLSLNWQLALVALLPFPVGAAVSYRYSALIAPRYRTVREAVGRLTSRVENSVSGIEVVKSFTNEDLERERITAASREYRDANVDVLRVWISFLPTLDAIRWYGVAGIVLLGGIWIIAGPPLFFTLPLTVGTLVTFVIYSQRFVRPIIRAGQLLNTYHDAKASVERVFSLIDYPADVEEAVHEAAEAVGADEFVTDLESGYGARVGDRGEALGGSASAPRPGPPRRRVARFRTPRRCRR
jgi:ATP-binding cassette subfamily B protein